MLCYSGHLTSVQFFIKGDDQGKPPLHNYVSVTIYFISESKQIPAFPLAIQSFTIEENLPVGAEVSAILSIEYLRQLYVCVVLYRS